MKKNSVFRSKTKIPAELFNGEFTAKELAERTGVSLVKIKSKYTWYKKKGYNVKLKRVYFSFKPSDLTYINENIGVEDTKAIADFLELPEAKIKDYISRNFPGLTRRRWAKNEIAFLLNNYKVYSFKTMARRLARSEAAIRQKIVKLQRSGRTFRYETTDTRYKGDA